MKAKKILVMIMVLTITCFVISGQTIKEESTYGIQSFSDTVKSAQVIMMKGLMNKNEKSCIEKMACKDNTETVKVTINTNRPTCGNYRQGGAVKELTRYYISAKGE